MVWPFTSSRSNRPVVSCARLFSSNNSAAFASWSTESRPCTALRASSTAELQAAQQALNRALSGASQNPL